MKSGRNLLKAVGLAVLLVSALGTQSALATIVGSKHDFTSGTASYKGTGNTANQVCIYCHAPHNNQNASGALLWNRAASALTYLPYTSPTMSATPLHTASTVAPVSKVCLSCHDGSIAVDSYGGRTGTVFATGVALIGNAASNGLSNDHPISFNYQSAITAGDTGLRATTAAANIGLAGVTTGTIAANLLTSTGNVECSSCHDVHATPAETAVTAKLLKITSAGSALCTTCHIK